MTEPSTISERVGTKAYWVAQQLAVLVINQYARTHDSGFELVCDEPGTYRYFPKATEADEHDLASLEGMLRLGVPWLWLAPAWWGTAFYFNGSTGSSQFFAGSILFAVGVVGWYSASQFTENTSVEHGYRNSGRFIELNKERGHHEVGDAIHRIERVEDELNQTDGVADIRERLTDARADLVDALLERELER